MSAVEGAKPIKKPKRALPEHLKSYKGVWVFVEHDQGHIHQVAFELLGAGRRLADKLGVELAGVILGDASPKVRAMVDEVYAYGADLCYLMQSEVLRD